MGDGLKFKLPAANLDVEFLLTPKLTDFLFSLSVVINYLIKVKIK